MTDLLSALQASVEAARAATGKPAETPAEPEEKKPAPRKTSSRKKDEDEAPRKRRKPA
jgi:DNA end-binding protein Ku